MNVKLVPTLCVRVSVNLPLPNSDLGMKRQMELTLDCDSEMYNRTVNHSDVDEI